jgi:hypothetical protein
MTMPSRDEMNRRILRNNIVKESQMGRGVRPHEIERTTDIAMTLFKGNKGNGQASREAIEIVRKGLAE